MNIFITGGTGFIGKALCSALLEQGHQLTVLTRHPDQQPALQGVTFVAKSAKLDGFDAVINLAGEPIFTRRWTPAQKQKLVASRVDLTQQLVEQIRQSPNPPKVLISGSATGFYGNLDFAENSEDLTPCGNQFPAPLCQQWENAAWQAQSDQTRVCVIRTGIVLGENGGALQQMLPLYRLGLGGKLGAGKQHWAWISLQDQVRAILFLLANPECQGAYNLVAPQSATNAEFNQKLAQKLKRPAFCHVPKWALRLALDERAQLLLDNQPLVPQRLLQAGFEFKHNSLADFFCV